MLVVLFLISNRIVHPSSWGISPVSHMYCNMATRHICCSIRRGVFDYYPGYAYLCHCLECSMWMWVCWTVLCGCRRCGLSVQCCLGPVNWSIYKYWSQWILLSQCLWSTKGSTEKWCNCINMEYSYKWPWSTFIFKLIRGWRYIMKINNDYFQYIYIYISYHAL